MKNIHFFNPETEIVLGLDQDIYTPNPRVVNFRRRLALLPALYAQKNDIILTEGINAEEIPHLPFHDMAIAKGMEIVPIEGPLKELALSPEDFSFQPWGWNKEVVRKMRIKLGGISLPAKEEIEIVRKLAHRGLTHSFFNFWKEQSDNHENDYPSPVIIDSEERLKEFLSLNNEFCLKAPWSSSGRGVILSSEFSSDKAYNWAASYIRKQGAVMGEPFYRVLHNLASEWQINEDKVCFLGLSFFKTSDSGKYIGNLLIPQKRIMEMIGEVTNNSLEEAIQIQREFINDKFLGSYRGPLGFDMLVTQEGWLNPCVEINVRKTMGHVAIEIERGLNSSEDSEIAALLDHCFPDRVFSPLSFV
ncbi:MAG: hypothetical protein HDS03_03110 [Bacteroides sp.]|nr:hypothetical protein [Bacteroides sp.]